MPAIRTDDDLAIAASPFGLVWAFHFPPGRNARPLDVSTAPEALVALEGWVWLHFNLADARSRRCLEAAGFADRHLLRDFLAGDEDLRIEWFDAGTVGVVTDVEQDFDHSGDDLARLRFLIRDRMIVTGRRRHLASVEAVRGMIARGDRFERPEAILEAIVSHQLQIARASLRQLHLDLAAIEDRVIAGLVEGSQNSLKPIRRTCSRLRRQITPLHYIFHDLDTEHAANLPEALDRLADRLARRCAAVLSEIADVTENSKVLQDEITAMIAQRSNRNLHFLSVISGLFLPPTLVTGIFGINAGGIPLAENANGFWWASAIALASAVILYLIMRRTGLQQNE